jgi:hypothetical protein
MIVLPALVLSPLRPDGSIRAAIADDAPDDPDDAQNPGDADGAAGERLRLGIEQFDQQVFGGEGPAAAAARRARLEKLLRREIAAYEWPCALADAQTKKLLVAGHGDIKRVLDRVDDMKKTFEKSAGDEVDINTYSRLLELASSAQAMLDSNPFGGDSMFRRTLQKSLSAQQAAQYDAVRTIHRFGGKFQSRKRWLGELKEIDLSVSSFADDGMPLLSRLTNVQFLNLDSTRVTDAGLVHLRALTGLEGLELGSTDVSGAGLAALRETTKLETLNLRSTKITDDALAHLKGLARLRYLRLSNTRITDAGLAYLKDLKALENLFLGATDVSDAGLVHLTGYAGLKELDLLNTRVTDAGLVHLAGLAHLEMLDLRNAAVTDAGLSHLRTLTNLNELYVAGTEVTDAGAAELRQALPRVKIYK